MKLMNMRTRFLPILALLAVVQGIFAQVPAGYYTSAQNLTGPQLQLALHNIIKGHTVKSYDYLWTAFATTDKLPGGNVCYDMYSYRTTATPPYTYTIPSNQCLITPGYENYCYNREHSFPKSWFGGEVSPMYTDLFHVIPTDSYVNSRRSDYPYGEVSAATWTSMNGSKLGPCAIDGYTGTVFEPVDEYKGDLARNYFYMVTRYADVVAGWENYSTESDAVLDGTQYPAFEPWTLNMLIQWHLSDPVSDKEVARNDSVYTIQGNRNPFIDYPGYVALMWPQYSPVLPEPTLYPSTFSGHNITLQWVDATGAVTPTAYLIRWSTTGFDQIADPENGTLYPNDNQTLNVPAGTGNALIRNLLPATTYYFKIFGYVTEGPFVTYKTSGAVPAVTATTSN